eukprot:scaffold62734_cov38-Attheya_sp.AAC.3
MSGQVSSTSSDQSNSTTAPDYPAVGIQFINREDLKKYIAAYTTTKGTPDFVFNRSKSGQCYVIHECSGDNCEGQVCGTIKRVKVSHGKSSTKGQPVIIHKSINCTCLPTNTDLHRALQENQTFPSWKAAKTAIDIYCQMVEKVPYYELGPNNSRF